jgi:fructokinase
MTPACRVAAIGEILWDVFDNSRTLGGAPLNFAAHCSRLGCEALVVSAVGEDEAGESALTGIWDSGVDTAFIRRVPSFPTGVARVQLGPNGQTSFRIERPAAYDAVSLSAEDCRKIAAWSPGWLYFGTLFAHEVRSWRTLNALASVLPGASKFYDVNLRPGCYSPDLVMELLALADVVKLNETEMSSVAGFAGLPGKRLEDFCAAGSARFGWDAVAVTLGERGCAVWRQGDYIEAPAYRIQVADTVGAGDAFDAAMLYGLCRGWQTRAVADFANQLGALVASRPGGIPEWNIDELCVPDRPFGAACPPGDVDPCDAPLRPRQSPVAP